jgi:hypothetical protein
VRIRGELRSTAPSSWQVSDLVGVADLVERLSLSPHQVHVQLCPGPLTPVENTARSVISYVLRRAYKAKHRLTRFNSASSAESSDSEDASPASTTVLVPGYRHNDLPASDA